MIDKEKVLAFVKQNGPVLPRDVVRAMGTDTFFTGAVLSQLVDNKEMKLSTAKIGGSPVYYVSGQEPKLELLYKFLPGKEKEAHDLLRSKKIVRDSEAEPAIRVALRSIKDFAKPLEVSINASKEIFWKWYLTPNGEAEQVIRNFLQPPEEQSVSAPERKQEIIQEQKHEALKAKAEKPKETKPADTQATIAQELPDSELIAKAKKFFSQKGIEIIETKIIRKSSEIDMIVKIPSSAGKLKYFCKIRDKKKSNDRDLSSLYVESQMRKLPVLYVTTGELTKKAEEMLESQFSMVSVSYLK